MTSELPAATHEEKVSKKEYEKAFENPESGLRFHYWYNGKTTKHSHDFFEVFIIVQGKINHTYNGETTILGENTMCLIKPDDVHQFMPISGISATHFNMSVSPLVFRALCAALNSSLYTKLCSANGLISYSLKENEYAYCSYLLNLLHTASDDADTELQSTIVKTLLSNCLLYFQTALKEEKAFPDWFSDFLNKVHSPDNFLQPIRHLYTLVPYSQPRLNSYFHKFIGCTLVSYVTKLKVNYSCSLLRYSNYSILQIAEMSGYNNLSHFNHTFKKQLGCAPKEYRERFISNV